jgi:hypothetical protein
VIVFGRWPLRATRVSLHSCKPAPITELTASINA